MSAILNIFVSMLSEIALCMKNTFDAPLEFGSIKLSCQVA